MVALSRIPACFAWLTLLLFSGNGAGVAVLWGRHGSSPALLVTLGSRRTFRRVVEDWARWHRWCARVLLGINQRIEGTIPSGQVLVALKHESFYEAIDLPAMFDRPSVFAKAELPRDYAMRMARARRSATRSSPARRTSPKR